MPIANDFDSLVETLEGWKGIFRGDQAPFPIWVTLSPYLTEEDLATFPPEIDTLSVPYVHDGYCERVANLIGTVRYRGIVSAVVNFNTIGNCIYREEGKPVTAPNGGKAGMSGSLLKQFSIQQNAVFRGLLPSSIDTIGCGGILHGDDSADFLDKKVVSAVMLTSLPHWFGGPKAFPKLLEESDRLLTHFYA
jgi:dihydroorotate dehydrogenase